MLSIVARTSFMSCRLAPSTANPIGTPCPSVSRLRLTPLLPRSVGLRPVFFPAQRRLGHRPIHAQPVPVDAVQVVKLLHARLPQLQKDAGLDPFLKAVVGGGLGAQGRSGSTPPIGSRCGARRRWHRHSGGRARAGGRHQSGACSHAWAAAAPAPPTAHRIRGNQSWSRCWVSAAAHGCGRLFAHAPPVPGYSDRLLVRLQPPDRAGLLGVEEHPGSRSMSDTSSGQLPKSQPPDAAESGGGHPAPGRRRVAIVRWCVAGDACTLTATLMIYASHHK